MPGQALNIVYGESDNRQVAQAKEVELDQADLLDVVLVVLGDDRTAAVGRVERTEIGELARRDEHTAGVHPDISRHVLKTPGQIEQVTNFFFRFELGLELRFGLNGFRQRQRLVLLDRDELRELIAEVVWQVEYSPDIADHRLR